MAYEKTDTNKYNTNTYDKKNPNTINIYCSSKDNSGFTSTKPPPGKFGQSLNEFYTKYDAASSGDKHVTKNKYLTYFFEDRFGILFNQVLNLFNPCVSRVSENRYILKYNLY